MIPQNINSNLLLFTVAFIVSFGLHFLIKKKMRGSISIIFSSSLFIIFFIGFLLADREGSELEYEMKDALIRQVKGLAENIDLDDINSLSFTEDDLGNTSYKRLCRQFYDYAKTIKVLGVYTLAKKGDKLIFGPESYLKDEPMASPPGTVYNDATKELKEIFKTGKAFTEGPLRDEYGVFVSALAPVFSAKSDEIMMVVGIDVDADDWIEIIVQKRLRVFYKIVLLVLILLIGNLLYEIKLNGKERTIEKLKYAEVYFIALFCLILTYFITDYLREHDNRQERKSFAGLAKISFLKQLKSIKDLKDYEIGGLERFFKGSEIVLEEEFLSYTEPIISQKWIESIIWSGLDIQANNGDILKNSGLEKKLKVDFIQSIENKDRLKGTSIIKNTAFIKPLVEALATGIPTSTIPYKALNGTMKRTMISAFFPVTLQRDNENKILGMITIELNLDLFLRDYNKNHKPYTVQKLFSLNEPSDTGEVGRTISTMWGINSLSDVGSSEHSFLYPLFVFGKSYALLILPDQNYSESNSIYSIYMVMIAGIVLTILIATITVVLIRRGFILKQMVNERTIELRKSELSLKTALKEAENANIEKDKFFSIIAHDLKTPFSGLLGFLKLLLDDEGDYTELQRKKLLGLLFESSKNLYSLLENLLQWSRIKRGMVQAEYTKIRVYDEITEVIKLSQTSIEKKELIVLLDESNLFITTDVRMLNLVMRNLLSNAIKFSNRGKTIYISMSETVNEITVKVKDEGIGMEPEILANIFKLGSSVGRSGTEGEVSTGLGLILCKEYLEKLGGRMWAISEKNIGSEFCFTLPKNVSAAN